MIFRRIFTIFRRQIACMNRFGKLLTFVLIFQITTYFSFTAFGQSNSVKEKFYVGIEGGLGLLKLSRNDLSSERNSCFSLGFNGGIIPFHWLRTGISMNGYLIESFGDFYKNTEKGISISNFYGPAEIFPFKKTNLYLNVSGGFSHYTNMHPDEFATNGTGAIIGIGHEQKLSKRVGVSFEINYGFGRLNDVKNIVATVKNQHYDITEFMIGFTYH